VRFPRYVELGDPAVRALGYKALNLGARPVKAPRAKGKTRSTLMTKEALAAVKGPCDSEEYTLNWDLAQKQFTFSKPLKDDKGVDFYVSFDSSDVSTAPQRWAALTQLSDRFEAKYGRLPRFWIADFCLDPDVRVDRDERAKIFAGTIMSCRFFLALQGPRYFGCSAPELRANPSGWALLETFVACSLAPSDDPTRNMLWLPLFTGRNVPPRLDLLHGQIRCADDEEREWILRKLAGFPGGMVEAGRVMSAIWLEHFKTAYCYWALCAEAAGKGDAAKVAELVAAGTSMDLPLDWGSQDTKLVAALAADILHEKWREAFSAQPGAAEGRWKPVDFDGADKGWYDKKIHSAMVRTPAGAAEGSGALEVNIDNPLVALPPSRRYETC